MNYTCPSSVLGSDHGDRRRHPSIDSEISLFECFSSTSTCSSSSSDCNNPSETEDDEEVSTIISTKKSGKEKSSHLSSLRPRSRHKYKFYLILLFKKLIFILIICIFIEKVKYTCPSSELGSELSVYKAGRRRRHPSIMDSEISLSLHSSSSSSSDSNDDNKKGNKNGAARRRAAKKRTGSVDRGGRRPGTKQ